MQIRKNVNTFQFKTTAFESETHLDEVFFMKTITCKRVFLNVLMNNNSQRFI